MITQTKDNFCPVRQVCNEINGIKTEKCKDCEAKAMEIVQVEMLRNSILPIIEENKFMADEPCTDTDVMEFLQAIHAGKEKAELFVSHVNWKSRPYQRDCDGMSDVFLRAVKLPDGRYYLTVEMPDLEDDDPVRQEYILRV